MKRIMRTLALLLALAAFFTLAACTSNSPASSAMEMNSENPSAGMMEMDMKLEMPENLDTSTTHMSELGVFKVSFQSSQPVGKINEIFSWTVHVETAAGTPVEEAEIAIHTSMPQHGHGMPTEPRVTQNLGQGDYLLEGLKYSMPGWWEITLDITANGKNDLVTFNQVLK